MRITIPSAATDIDKRLTKLFPDSNAVRLAAILLPICFVAINKTHSLYISPSAEFKIADLRKGVTMAGPYLMLGFVAIPYPWTPAVPRGSTPCCARGLSPNPTGRVIIREGMPWGRGGTRAARPIQPVALTLDVARVSKRRGIEARSGPKPGRSSVSPLMRGAGGSAISPPGPGGAGRAPRRGTCRSPGR